jgi:hypothetical protein
MPAGRRPGRRAVRHRGPLHLQHLQLAQRRLDLARGARQPGGPARGQQQLLALQPVAEPLDQLTLAPQDGGEVGKAHQVSSRCGDALLVSCRHAGGGPERLPAANPPGPDG